MARKDKGIVTGDPVTYQIPDPAGGVKLETFIPWTLVKRGGKREVVTPLNAPEQFQAEATFEREKRMHAQDSALIRALGLAHYWQSLLESGKVATPADIACKEGIEVSRVRDLLQLTLLAPGSVENILVDKQPRRVTLEFFVRRTLPRNWEAQKAMLASTS